MSKASQSTAHSRLRTTVAVVLVILGCIGATTFVAVRWAEKNILDTNGWTKLVSQVPKDHEVATALSTNLVDQLFEQYDVQTVVAQALPDKAQFLAGPLTDQIQQKSRDVGTQFIQSEQFQGIWISANQIAQSRIVNQARADTMPNQSKVSAFALNLQGAQERIKERLGSTGTSVYSGALPAERPITVNLKALLGSTRDVIRTTDTAYAVLPPMVLALFLWAIAIAPRRRKMVLVLGFGIFFTAALQIIALKLARPEIIDLVKQAQFRGAVSNVWDILTNPYATIAWRMLIIGVVVICAAAAFGPSKPAAWLQQLLRLPSLGNTAFSTTWRRAAQALYSRRWYARLAIIVLIVGYLLIATTLTWTIMIQVMLWGFVAGAVLQLLLQGASSRRLPAKG